MEKLSTLLVLFNTFYSISGLSLPADFQKCKRSDPKRDECLKAAIQDAIPKLAKGLPEFNFDPIDPIKIPSMTISPGTGAVHVEQRYEHIEFHNVPTIKIDKVESTVTDTEVKLVIDGHSEIVFMNAQYKLDGHILVLPIVGEGACKITLTDVKAKLTLIGEIFKKKGRNYGEIKTSEFVMEPGLVEFDFQNLFNGDSVLGPEILTVLNDNWKELYADVRHGYEAALATIFKNYGNLIIARVPYDELLGQ